MQQQLTDKEVMEQALDALTDCMDHTLGMADRANYASRAAIRLRSAIAAYGQPGKGMPELPPGVMIGRPHEEVWTRERALAFGRDCFAAKDAEIVSLANEVRPDLPEPATTVEDAIHRIRKLYVAHTLDAKTVQRRGQRIDELEAEIAALRKDAERLDFLGKLRAWAHSGDGYYVSTVTLKWGDSIKRRDLRTAVDEAIAQAVQPS